MRNATEGRFVVIGLALLGLAGCRREAPQAFKNYTPSMPPSTVSSGFEELQKASLAAKEIGGDYEQRVSLTQTEKLKLISSLAGPIRQVESALTGNQAFSFIPHKPFEKDTYRFGWGLIGKALGWKVEVGIARGDYDAAIRDAVLATKFGFFLTGGSAMDASLGFSITDDARRALAPSITLFGAAQLQSLAKGLTDALKGKPALVVMIDNERQNMKLSVQFIQDLYRDHKLETLETDLGTGVKDGIEFLNNIKPDSQKRIAYFEGLDDEATRQTDWLKTLSAMTQNEREMKKGPALASERPWKKIAPHFFLAAKPLLAVNDASVARTKLTILEALLLVLIKVNGKPPKDLSGFDPELCTDPYTGEPFVYKADGADHKLYSMGADFKDDGGETDDSYSIPDLTIEARLP